MRIGIVSLQRKPPDVATWMRYHADVGVSHFYIGLEDSEAWEAVIAATAARLGVRAHVEIGAPVDRRREDNYTDIQTRQQDFVTRMLAQSQADGVEWLFHIDDDELLHARGDAGQDTWRDILSRVPDDCASVHMTNWEGFSPAQPDGSWLTDGGVRYMTSSCRHLFAAYTNGKSASRTRHGQSGWGPHHFLGGKECQLPESEGVVLHHDSLAMSSSDLPPRVWFEKNKLRATSDMSKIPFDATKESVAAVVHGTPESQQAVWEKFRSQKGEQYQQCPSTVALTLPSHSY